jgi:hypothetical protein
MIPGNALHNFTRLTVATAAVKKRHAAGDMSERLWQTENQGRPAIRYVGHLAEPHPTEH